MLGYEDANDLSHLKQDPLLRYFLQCDLASQPTISRFENSHTKPSIFDLCNLWGDYYVACLKGREHIVIDVDETDDSTYDN